MNLLYSHPHCGSPHTFKQNFCKIGYGSMRRSGYSMPLVIPSNPKLLTFQPGTSAWRYRPLYATTTALCLVFTQPVPDQRTPQRENYGLYFFQFFFCHVGTSAAWLQVGYACFFRPCNSPDHHPTRLNTQSSSTQTQACNSPVCW